MRISCAQRLVYGSNLALQQDQVVFHGAQQVAGVTAMTASQSWKPQLSDAAKADRDARAQVRHPTPGWMLGASG